MNTPAARRHDHAGDHAPRPRSTLRSVLALASLAAMVLFALHWMAQRDDERLAARIVAGAQPGDIHMLSSVTCPYCVAARGWLQAHAIPFDECFIERDSACAEQFRHTGAVGTPTFLVRGQRVGGFDRPRLADALR